MNEKKLTPRQRALWKELCELVDVDPEWLAQTLGEYEKVAEQYGLMEMSDELLNAKFAFGWVEHAVQLMDD